MTIVEAAPGITGGVDTHLDKHVAAALDPLGRLVGTESFNADAGGYKALLAWLEEFGQVTKVGVEGTGSYGSGSPGSCAGRASRSSKSIDPTPGPGATRASPTPSMRSRPPGPPSAVGRPVGQDQGRSRRGHPGPGGGQALGPTGSGQGHRPDAPSRNHRP